MWLFGNTKVGTNPTFTQNLFPINPQESWLINWLYKDGTIKRSFSLGFENPIKSIKIENNQRVTGSADIDLLYIDFPIHIKDKLEIFYKGVKKYTGFISNLPDAKGDKIKIQPYHSIFDNLLYNGSFTNKTIKEIFQTIVQSKFSITGIQWIDYYIDIDDPALYSFSYEYESCKKIFDDLIDLLDDRYYGVNELNIFTIYQDETALTKIIDGQDFASLSIEQNYDDIEQTRFQLFQKDIDDNNVRVGEIGYDSEESADFPPIDLENIVFQKEGKYNINISDYSLLECQTLGYSKLLSLQAPYSVKVKGINIDSYYPRIGDKVRLVDQLFLANKTVLNCSQVTNDADLNFFSDGNDEWNSINGTVSIDLVNYVNNKKSVKYATETGKENTLYYNFVNYLKIENPRKLNFMVRSNKITTFKLQLIAGSNALIDESGNFLIDEDGFFLGDDDGIVKEINFSIENVNKWILKTIDLKSYTVEKIKKISFIFPSMSSEANINIGDVSIFADWKDEIEGNVKKVNITIDDKKNNLADIELNTYSRQLNDTFFALEKKVKELELIGQNQGA